MKKISIYVDTSVIEGCLDREFALWSRGLLADFKAGNFSLILSELIDAEIADSPSEVIFVYEEFRSCASKIIEISNETIELADSYLKHRILTKKFRDDARHISLATVSGSDLLVSWNFKHIVNFEKIRKFNAVNIEMGYNQIAIYSPMEVTKYGKSR